LSSRTASTTACRRLRRSLSKRSNSFCLEVLPYYGNNLRTMLKYDYRLLTFTDEASYYRLQAKFNSREIHRSEQGDRPQQWCLCPMPSQPIWASSTAFDSRQQSSSGCWNESRGRRSPLPVRPGPHTLGCRWWWPSVLAFGDVRAVNRFAQRLKLTRVHVLSEDLHAKNGIWSGKLFRR
jgi:hypothetical protein